MMKLCKNCFRSVNKTVGNCGYCKRCIELAQKERKEKEWILYRKNLHKGEKRREYKLDLTKKLG